MARHLDGKALKCVTEKVNGIEEVIGHAGAIVVKGEEIIIYASQDVLFRANIYEMKAWELMSLDGVVITAQDTEHDCSERTVIAYYSYWRDVSE